MGIETQTYKELRSLAANAAPLQSILCLGYPDLLVDPAEFSRSYVERPDADKIRSWHNWSGPVYDTTEVLQNELGIKEVVYADIVSHRGEERIIDLNTRIEWGRTYDVVLDGGTSEHCFNIGQVFDNIHRAVGRFVIHVNPLNMVNHGFWNISPTAYHDFYGQNGYTMVSGSVMHGHPDRRWHTELEEASMTGRFKLRNAAEMTNLFVAEKAVGGSGQTIWPVQHKYKSIIGA